MKKPNRFSLAGEWEFVGKGKLFDVERDVEVEAQMVFKSLPPTIETNPANRDDVTANLKLVRDEKRGMWEIIVLDEENTVK